MPGFFVSNCNADFDLHERMEDRFIRQKANTPTEDITMLSLTLNKFLDDKLFVNNDAYIVILEGYLLNKADLLKQYKQSSLYDLVVTLYQEKGEVFPEVFRGCFSGVLLDKQKNSWQVFTNQIGDNPVFYYFDGAVFAAASQVKYLIDFCKSCGRLLTFNESCAYQLLTFGYVATNETYANEIGRLGGGEYLVFKNGEARIKKYHRFEKHPDRFAKSTESEMIDAIDAAFRNAVRLEWGKDTEYGYKHLSDLSGGLDSRMNYWVAHEMCPCRSLVLTYSKAGYLDETIAEAIAQKWNDELIFKALDDISFLYDIDENVEMLGGLSLYAAITGGKRLLETLNLDGYGIEHTGQVGDAALGSFFKSPNDGIHKQPKGMYSQRLEARLSETVNNWDQNYDDYEVYLMYVRGFHGACNSHLIRRNYTEVGSPFLNVEFLQLCFDIPVKYRIGHNIYRKWILKKYPGAAEFRWEKTGTKLTEGKAVAFIGRAIKRGPNKIKSKLGLYRNIRSGMNPLGYWLRNNVDVREYMNGYEQNGYRWLPVGVSEQLVNDLKMLYATGSAYEKTMVLTVLAAAKLYFGEGQ